jgi:hypothetical protein
MVRARLWWSLVAACVVAAVLPAGGVWLTLFLV